MTGQYFNFLWIKIRCIQIDNNNSVSSYIIDTLKLLFVRWVPNFGGFCGLARQRNLLSKENVILIDMFTENFKTMNSRNQELLYLP